jgi:nucleoid-associated protein EbfC
MGMNPQAMLKQAKKMQKQMEEAQAAAAAEVVEGSAGGGMVVVHASGEMRVRDIRIDPEAVDADDVEMLQDLVLAAVNQALENAQEMTAEKMGAVTGGLNIPGLF